MIKLNLVSRPFNQPYINYYTTNLGPGNGITNTLSIQCSYINKFKVAMCHVGPQKKGVRPRLLLFRPHKKFCHFLIFLVAYVLKKHFLK
ncbi:hypothetical protein SAMN05216167_112119 [Spirosoma endophyticum]|uniref:Uncharacterized protein n=1 Tax=Spirosoma endophyticum TaxID=662367 RepID=A0A1I1ZI82_9BACT|nr:hypothetical protein SAMN05216167_112119 [Spirosoma endophyticum]